MDNPDKKYMLKALDLARKAYSIGEVPVGALIVREGKILGKAYNKKETNGIATHHAEILAIQKASKKLRNWRLNDSTIYVTLEPCEMCMAAIKEARISNIIYGTSDNKTSVTNSKQIKIAIDDLDIKKTAEELLKSFFESKRN